MLIKTLYAVGKAGNCFNAHAPDYPGCLATGQTAREAKERLLLALQAHITAMVEDGDELPEEDLDGGFLVVEVPDASGQAPDGAALRAYRKRNGMTQEAMAARLEVTKATINEWERGKRPLPGTVKFALSAIG